MQDNLDRRELQHFSSISDKWWDEEGPFAPLHALNPVRLRYILDQIHHHYDIDEDSHTPLKGLKILDVGCGGGLVSEPLARLGGDVTGIDADQQAIEVARSHADEEGLNITYKQTTSDALALTHKGGFDIVCGLEIIEHVKVPEDFVQSLFDLTKDSGLVLISTLNRTAKSYLLSIIGAEYILKWLPKGTHTWSSFIRPHELAAYVRRSGGRPVNVRGFVYNPLSREFSTDKKDLDNNYILTATKSNKTD